MRGRLGHRRSRGGGMSSDSLQTPPQRGDRVMANNGRPLDSVVSLMTPSIRSARASTTCWPRCGVTLQAFALPTPAGFVTHFFGAPRSKGSSHHVNKMPWAGDPRISLQPGSGGKAKPYPVRQALQAVDRLLQEKKL